MTYQTTEWKNDGTPAISADNLNNMENGIAYANSMLIGFVSFYCKDKAPNGWLVCDGGEVSRETYADLFDRIGTTFGIGDGTTTFNLPNLTGRFIRGYGGDSGEFGAYQSGTTFSKDKPNYILYGAETVEGQFTSGGFSFWSGDPETTAYKSRPDNVALLPCIYTGVLS